MAKENERGPFWLIIEHAIDNYRRTQSYSKACKSVDKELNEAIEAAKREALEKAEANLRRIGTEQAQQVMRTLLTAINNGTDAKVFAEGYLEMDAKLGQPEAKEVK